MTIIISCEDIGLGELDNRLRIASAHNQEVILLISEDVGLGELHNLLEVASKYQRVIIERR